MLGIYQIRNNINGKVYIGSAIDITKRWYRHKTYLNAGKHHSKHLQRAWDKYGKKNFTFEVIEEVPCTKDLITREQFLLDHYKCHTENNGYNVCKIAGSCLGVKRSSEAIEKTRKANTGKIRSEESKARQSASRMGMKLSESTKKKLSDIHKGKSYRVYKKGRENPNYGRKASAETIKKLSETHKGHTPSKETREKLSLATKRFWQRRKNG